MNNSARINKEGVKIMEKNNLKKIRVEKGLSQSKLSFTTRIAPNIICNIENNRVHAYPNWRKKIAQALNVSEKEIWGQNNE